MNTIEQNIALSCTFSKDSKYLAVTHLNAPHITIYETGEIDIFTKMNALISPDGDQGLGSSSSFSDENEYLAITYNNSPYVAVIKAQRNPNEKHTYLLDNDFSTVSSLLDTPLIELGYASESGTQLQNKKVKLI
ncbi:MAG: hypothetical protein PHF25_09370 [Candidatus Margulisbacteria bacterium]|nr:hypothetical protein [Candidatus Margulisiibacteriota bacterium]